MWKVKKSKIHGSGVYASKEIKKGEKIIEYIGEKILKNEGDKRSGNRIKKNLHKGDDGLVYIFELNSKYDIDGSPLYNKARYINHSCNPNCEVEIFNDHIWIVSLRKIRKDEELTYDYGFSFDSDYKQFPCKCRAKNCCGYIVREESRWRINKKFKKNIRINR